MPKGIIKIHGRDYQTVAYRITKFRQQCPILQGWAIETEVLHSDQDMVMCKATIISPDGKKIATGHSEERRDQGHINRTSALENAETSAVGRALAMAGYGGEEFDIATANEVMNAMQSAYQPQKTQWTDPGNVAKGPATTQTRPVSEMTRQQLIEKYTRTRIWQNEKFPHSYTILHEGKPFDNTNNFTWFGLAENCARAKAAANVHKNKQLAIFYQDPKDGKAKEVPHIWHLRLLKLNGLQQQSNDKISESEEAIYYTKCDIIYHLYSEMKERFEKEETERLEKEKEAK